MSGPGLRLESWPKTRGIRQSKTLHPQCRTVGSFALGRCDFVAFMGSAEVRDLCQVPCIVWSRLEAADRLHQRITRQGSWPIVSDKLRRLHSVRSQLA